MSANACASTSAALERWLEDHVDGFAGPLTVSQFKGGQSNPTYRLDTPSSGAFVLRRKPPGKLLPGAHAVEREYRVMRRSARKASRSRASMACARTRASSARPSTSWTWSTGRIVWEAHLPRPVARRARGALRRDERDHRPAPQLRSAGDRARRLWPRRPASSNGRWRAGRSNIWPTPRPAACRRWTGWSTGSASIFRPTAARRASSMAIFAATI